MRDAERELKNARIDRLVHALTRVKHPCRNPRNSRILIAASKICITCSAHLFRWGSWHQSAQCSTGFFFFLKE